MRRSLLFVLLVMILILPSCSKSPNANVIVSKSAQEYVGQQYESVLRELGDLGFQNIVKNELADVTEDNLSNMGTVESIAIAGNVDFPAESSYPRDAEVVLTYHTPMKIPVPMAATEFQYIEYQEAATILAEAGFTNISTDVVVDQDPDELNAEFINEVEISSTTSFNAGDVFAYNSPISVVCHLPYNKHDVNIHIKFEGNLLFSKYDVDYSFGDIDSGTLPHGEDKDLDLRVREGSYILTFSENGADANCAEFNIDVQDDMEVGLELHCANDEITVETSYIELKHAAGKGEATVPESSRNLNSKNYKDVEKQFSDAGFTNISLEVQYDIIWGWTEEGSVAEVLIDGTTDFVRGDIYKASAPVIIKYHMKFADDPNEEARTYQGVVYDRAYYHSEPDGVKAHKYEYYFFNESKGLALYAYRETAGPGLSLTYTGTYSGSFGNEIVFHTTDGRDRHFLFYDNGDMYEESDSYTKKTFSPKDVSSSLRAIQYW